ncbi:hypothetical protein CL656_01820 [bacterium]|nr:hypothetical protein [bacterium]|tara:strand:- start:2787 stop:3539 length:753 start_codon:yes stop_codon:yes gene_type:complete
MKNKFYKTVEELVLQHAKIESEKLLLEQQSQKLNVYMTRVKESILDIIADRHPSLNSIITQTLIDSSPQSILIALTMIDSLDPQLLDSLSFPTEYSFEDFFNRKFIENPNTPISLSEIIHEDFSFLEFEKFRLKFNQENIGKIFLDDNSLEVNATAYHFENFDNIIMNRNRHRRTNSSDNRAYLYTNLIIHSYDLHRGTNIRNILARSNFQRSPFNNYFKVEYKRTGYVKLIPTDTFYQLFKTDTDIDTN